MMLWRPGHWSGANWFEHKITTREGLDGRSDRNVVLLKLNSQFASAVPNVLEIKYAQFKIFFYHLYIQI